MSLVKEENFGIARKIVSNMTYESWRDIPHAGIVLDLDATCLMEKIKQLNSGLTDKSKKLTVNTVMLKIICESIKAAPVMNSHLEFNKKLVRGTLKTFDNIDISMPTVLPNGEMMTVNLHNMENKSLYEMADTINDTMRRAKNTNLNEVMFSVSMDNTLKGLKKGMLLQAIRRLYGAKMPGKHRVKTLSGKQKREYYKIPESDRLTLHDIEQGTITVSNLGAIDREQSFACSLLEVVPPQTTVIAINPVKEKPWVIKNEKGESEIAIRKIMPITVMFDHKALDLGDLIPFTKRMEEIFNNSQLLDEWK